MIGWRQDGTYSHQWLWSREVRQMFYRPSRDSKQLRYTRRYFNRGRNMTYLHRSLTMCTYPYLRK